MRVDQDAVVGVAEEDDLAAARLTVDVDGDPSRNADPQVTDPERSLDVRLSEREVEVGEVDVEIPDAELYLSCRAATCIGWTLRSPTPAKIGTRTASERTSASRRPKNPSTITPPRKRRRRGGAASTVAVLPVSVAVASAAGGAASRVAVVLVSVAVASAAGGAASTVTVVLVSVAVASAAGSLFGP